MKIGALRQLRLAASAAGSARLSCQPAAPKQRTTRKVVTVPNEKNLVSIADRTTSEQREIQSAGGKASGAARRRRRALKEAADLYLSLPVSDKRRRNALARRGLDPEDVDNQMAMIVGLTDAAADGDARAGRLILDILGEDGRDDPDAAQLAAAEKLLGGIDSVID